MTQKMIDHLRTSLTKHVSDMWVVTFVESNEYKGGYDIHHHYNRFFPKERNGLFLNYEMCIKLGIEEIFNIKIGIIAWLCQDNMIKYVKLTPKDETEQPSAIHGNILDPYPDELFYVTLENFIGSIKAGLTLEKIIIT